jgi:hypothetical protein
MMMKILLALEELFLVGLCLFLYASLGYAWWWFAVFFFAPDLSMVAYAAGPRVGAIGYNLVHHKAVAIGCFLLGVVLANTALQFAGLIMLAHSSMDRMLGYGLKYPDAFQHTHLGWIGRQGGQEN